MPAKKIRKREYIPPSHEVVNRKERTTSAPRVTKSTRTAAPRGGGARGQYEYPQPSWRRTFKRLPIYFLLIFALQYFMPSEAAKNSSDSERLFVAAGLAAVITIVFAPFMHMMDRMAYNRWLKRTGQTKA